MTLVTFGEASLWLAPPTGDRLSSADSLRVRVDGVESNAAVTAASLDTDAVWLSRLPETPLGERVAGALRGYGIDVDATWVHEGRQGVRFFERGNGPRADHAVDDVEDAAVTTVSAEELAVQRLAGADAFYTSAATMALSRDLARTCATLMKTAVSNDVRTAFSLTDRGRWTEEMARDAAERVLPDVDVLVARESDAARLVERPDQTPREMAHTLASRYDVEQVAITRGERGAIVWEDSTVNERRAVETPTVDPTGSHDAFAGAFLSRSLAGARVAEALDFGVAGATLARTVAGPVLTATADEYRATIAAMDEADR
ncbi:PfkB family carbohydrate kinase [Halomarina salina]|uniref:PfkB family carbohydrate kinase n=1 Tax=Halomarina salina TaxID=1872699 RepID=A0ABD5RKP2_9EURY